MKDKLAPIVLFLVFALCLIVGIAQDAAAEHSKAVTDKALAKVLEGTEVKEQ